MVSLDRLKALNLLIECTGDDIWSVELCDSRGVPTVWMEELVDCFESNLQDNSQTIFVGERVTNQFEGIRDVDLARKLGEFLGVQVNLLEPLAHTRADLVRMINEEVEEG